MTNTSPNHKCLFKVVLHVCSTIPWEAMTCCLQLIDFRQWPFKTAYCHFCTLEASGGESCYFSLQKSLTCHLTVSEIIKSKLHIIYLMWLLSSFYMLIFFMWLCEIILISKFFSGGRRPESIISKVLLAEWT